MPENSEMIDWMRQKNKPLSSFVCFQISGFNDDVNTQKQIFHFVYLLQQCSHQILGSVLSRQYRTLARENNSKICTFAGMPFFQWSFLCRIHHCCFNSSTFASWVSVDLKLTQRFFSGYSGFLPLSKWTPASMLSTRLDKTWQEGVLS